MKKFTVILVIVALAASLAVSCGGKGGQLIGVAMPETAVLRWLKDGNALVTEAEKRGYRAELQFADGKDQSIQNQHIQSFLTQRAKILIVGCIDEGVAAVVSEAAIEKVPVIAYDRIIQNSEDYDYYITFDNIKVGNLQGQSIVDALDLDNTAATKVITLFAGSPTDANANFFFQGAMDVLLPYIDAGKLRVVGPFPRSYTDTNTFQRITTEGWDANIAKQRMENLLSGDARSVTLDAVLAPNDTLAQAIIEALKSDAKYRGKLPVVTGQDAEWKSALSIKNGEQYSTIFKDTSKLAEAAIILAEQILKKQPINIPGAVLAEGDRIEISNTGKKYVTTYLLDPILITADNISVPLDAGFFDNVPERALLR